MAIKPFFVDQNAQVDGNITIGGYLAGPASFTIDPAGVGDNTGTVIIAGNLQVDGTQTIINSTTMTVDDLNIVVASGAANAAAADGAGLTVDGANATLVYNSIDDSFVFNKTPYHNTDKLLIFTDLSVTQNTASGNGTLSYNNTNGVFSYTPPDLSGYLTAETNDLTSAVTWANVPDANITQTSVTQHQAALAINESQITFTSSFIELTDLSVTQNTASGNGTLAYDNLTGVFTYTPPDLSGYLTTETQTLDDVTTLGSTTTNDISVNTLTSTVAAGTAPLTVASDTVVTNLNADKLDGRDYDEIIAEATALAIALG